MFKCNKNYQPVSDVQINKINSMVISVKILLAYLGP